MLLSSINALDACTVISAAEGDMILGGTNKDWHNINTRIQVSQPQKESTVASILDTRYRRVSKMSAGSTSMGSGMMELHSPNDMTLRTI